MTKLLDDAVATVRNLPPDEQDNIARAVLRLAGTDDGAPVALLSDECAAIVASKSAAARGEFVTEEQVRAVWAKYVRSPAAKEPSPRNSAMGYNVSLAAISELPN